jgi:hypothetical protein
MFYGDMPLLHSILVLTVFMLLHRLVSRYLAVTAGGAVGAVWRHGPIRRST